MIKKVLSFCVPVYNTADATIKLVEQLLSCEDTRFEVVIVDNHSKDGLLERLEHFSDSRLRLYSNDSNIGAQLNWYTALERGCGQWLYLVMGRDRLEASGISSLIDALSSLDISQTGFAVDRKMKDSGVKMMNRCDALCTFIGVDHPTGLILNQNLYKEFEDRRDWFADSDNIYPENIVKMKLLGRYVAAIISAGVFLYKTNSNKTIIKSAVAGHSETAYWTPMGRKMTYVKIMDVLNANNYLDDKEYDRFFVQKAGDYMTWVTKGWRDDCRNNEWCMHYGTSTRFVPTKELVRNALCAFGVIRRKYKGRCRLRVIMDIHRLLYKTLLNCLVK